MSPLTMFLGEFFGLAIALMCVCLVVRPRAALAALDSLTANPGVLYITGAFTLAGGVATLIGHGQWSGGAVSLVVTVLGWAMLIKGLALMLVPPGGLTAFYGFVRTPARLRIVGVIYLFLALWLAWAALHGVPDVGV